MSRRTGTTLIAVSIAAILFLYSHFSDKKENPGEQTLYSLAPEQINRIEIQEGQNKLELIREPSGVWKVMPQEGESFTADPVKVSEILNFSSKPQARKVEIFQPQWATFGLEPPQKNLVFETSSHPPVKKTLHVGRKSPVGWDVYLRVAGEKSLYLIPQYRISTFSADPKKFQSPPPPTETKP